MNQRYIQQLKKGSMELILLTLVAQKKETYGYEIITILNRQGGALFEYAREGTIYPVLYRLEEEGLLETVQKASGSPGRAKKYYRITPAGETAQQEMVQTWKLYVDSVNQFLDYSEED